MDNEKSNKENVLDDLGFHVNKNFTSNSRGRILRKLENDIRELDTDEQIRDYLNFQKTRYKSAYIKLLIYKLLNIVDPK